MSEDVLQPGTGAALIHIRFLRDNVNIYRRRLSQETMDHAEVKKFFPIPNQRTPEDNLGDVFGAHEIGDGVGDASALEANDQRA